MEFDLLVRRAQAAGYYVNRHKNWDPTRGTGELYLQRAKKFRNEHAETLAQANATADQIHAALSKLGA